MKNIYSTKNLKKWIKWCWINIFKKKWIHKIMLSYIYVNFSQILMLYCDFFFHDGVSICNQAKKKFLNDWLILFSDFLYTNIPRSYGTWLMVKMKTVIIYLCRCLCFWNRLIGPEGRVFANGPGRLGLNLNDFKNGTCYLLA